MCFVACQKCVSGRINVTVSWVLREAIIAKVPVSHQLADHLLQLGTTILLLKKNFFDCTFVE